MPKINNESNVLIAAHGNSLRALIMKLDSISSEEIVKLEIPTGAPIHYEFGQDGEVLSKNNLYEKEGRSLIYYQMLGLSLLELGKTKEFTDLILKISKHKLVKIS